MTAGEGGKDFFVSYSGADRAWAEWIAWVLEEAGYAVVLQAWDFHAGENFIANMHRTLEATIRTLAVLSPAYCNSTYCQDEWTAALAKARQDGADRLLPVRIADFAPPGLFAPIAYLDLVGVEEGEARGRLLAGVKRTRAKPETVPPFPRGYARAVVEKPRFPGALPSSRFQLKADLDDLTGRDSELKKLLNFFRGKEQHTTIACIWGMAGVGKSVMATHLAYRMKDTYPDARIFIDLEGTSDSPTKPMDAMGQVIHSLHPEASLPTITAGMERTIYRSILSSERLIILLDNASSVEQVRDLIPAEHCAVIITSRSFLDWGLDHALRMELKLLKLEDACSLLQSITDRVDDTEARLVAEACDRLPLALRAAGNLLEKYQDWDAKSFLDELTNESDRSKRLGVDKTLSLSAAVLGREDPKLLALWQMLSVFPGSFDKEAAASVWNVSGAAGPDTTSALSTLCSHSLLLYDETDKRYRLHDLMVDIARKAFRYYRRGRHSINEARLEAAAQRHANYYQGILRRATEFFRDRNKVREGLALCDRELHNIRVGFRWSAAHYRTNRDAAVLCVGYPNIGSTLLWLRLHPKEWIKWLRAALRAAGSLEDWKSQAVQLRRLGMTYFRFGRSKRAIRCLEIARRIVEKLEFPIEESRILVELARAQQPSSIRKSQELLEAAVAIASENRLQRSKMFALIELADLMRDLGHTKRAKDYIEEALTIARDNRDVQVVVRLLEEMGRSYQEFGQSEQAILHYQGALEEEQSINDLRQRCSILSQLGPAYRNVGKLDDAIQCGENALKIAQELADISQQADIVRELGIAYRIKSDFKKAIGYHNDQLLIGKRLGDLRIQGRALNNLGLDYADAGDMALAQGYQLRALSLMEEAGDLFAEAYIHIHLGAIFVEVGDINNARKQTEIAEKILENQDLDRRAEGLIAQNKGRVAYLERNFVRAIEFYNKELSGAKKNGGDRLGKGYTYAYIGAACRDNRDYRNAFRYLSMALKIMKTFSNLTGMCRVINDIAIYYRLVGVYDKALQYHEEGLTLARQINNQRVEGKILLEAALTHDDLGDRTAAIAQAERAAETLGSIDPEGAAAARKCILRLKGHEPVYFETKEPVYFETKPRLLVYRGGKANENIKGSTIAVVFAGNKRKALIMSFDDGTKYDRRLVDMFDTHGIRGTFHLNSGNIGKEGYMSAEDVRQCYNGHEISAHTVRHPDLMELSDDDVRREIEDDVRVLQHLSERRIRGLAYPFGNYDDRVIAVMKELGIAYGRTIDDTNDFAIADDFMKMTTTCHYGRAMDLADKFLGGATSGLWVMTVWGHSYELEGKLTDDQTKNWNYMEKFCKKVCEHDNVWYATTIEVVDYVNAARQLRLSWSGQTVTNPGDIAVWIEWRGSCLEVPAGESVYLR